MSHCPTCKESIISQTPSLIGKTECTSDCPEAITCQDIIPSNCVFYSGSNLSCSGINFGDSLSLAFSKIDTLLCNTGGCKVKVSATDTCCDYLETKVTAGTGVTVTKTTAIAGICEKLVISVNPATLVWNTIPLTSNFETIVLYQPPEYSNKDALGRVWFRGVFRNTVQVAGSTQYPISTSLLPTSVRPKYLRTYFNGRGAGSADPSPELTITDGGQIYIQWKVFVLDKKGLFSLDGFVIEAKGY